MERLTMGEIYKCNQCSYESLWDFAIKQHKKIHQAKQEFDCTKRINFYSCLTCDFKTPLKVEAHINPTTCIKEQILKEHSYFAPKSSQRVYSCQNCRFSTYSQLLFIKHHRKSCIRDKTVNPTFDYIICKICSYEAEHRSDLKRHMLDNHDHLDLQKFRGGFMYCKFCQYEAISKQDLKSHMFEAHTMPERPPVKQPANPTSNKWFNCNHCSFRAKRRATVRHHFVGEHLLKSPAPVPKQECHLDKPAKSFKCPYCPYDVKQYNTLKFHLKSKHDVRDVELHHCHECMFITTVECELKKHVLFKHKMWYKCGQCPFKTSVRTLFKWHQEQHNEIKDSEEVILGI